MRFIHGIENIVVVFIMGCCWVLLHCMDDFSFLSRHQLKNILGGFQFGANLFNQQTWVYFLGLTDRGLPLCLQVCQSFSAEVLFIYGSPWDCSESVLVGEYGVHQGPGGFIHWKGSESPCPYWQRLRHSQRLRGWGREKQNKALISCSHIFPN